MVDVRAELERLSEHDPVLARLLREKDQPTADAYIWMQWENGPPQDVDDDEQRVINLLTALERQRLLEGHLLTRHRAAHALFQRAARVVSPQPKRLSVSLRPGGSASPVALSACWTTRH
jgi:hypothetical protein